MEKYSEYKAAGLEWIEEIPSHWETKRFDFIFSFSRGLPITKQNLRSQGIPCVNYGEIHSKFGFKVDPEIHALKCVDEEYLLTNDKSLLSRGDIVFADTSEDIEGSGNFTHLDSDIPTFAGYHTIIARNRTENNYRFLAYFLDSIEYRNQIRSNVSGVKVYSITNSILKYSKFFIPPIEEQTKIANYLDFKTAEIDNIIATKKKLIELYEEEKTAVINKAVTKGINPAVKLKPSGVEWLGDIPEQWDIIRLKYIGESIMGMTYSPDDIVFDSDEGTLVLRSSNIQGGKLSLKDNVYISKEIPEKLIARNGDILLCSRNGSRHLIGKNICIDERTEGQTFGAFMTVFRTPHFKFLQLFFNSNVFKALSGLFLTSTINQLTINTLNNFVIGLPNPQEQEEIVDFVKIKTSVFNNKIALAKKQLDLLKEYRTTLISEVVTGKIKVTE